MEDVRANKQVLQYKYRGREILPLTRSANAENALPPVFCVTHSILGLAGIIPKAIFAGKIK